MTAATDQEWLLAALRTYRAAGFFADRSAMSDAELAELLQDEHEDEWAERLGPDPNVPVLAEVRVLAYDRVRTWWQDLEADVAPGNDIYVRVLNEWAAISGGAFRPDRLAERWATPDGPVTLDVEIGDRRWELRATVREDWLDLGVLDGLNAVLAETRAPRRFVALLPGDQTALVAALDAGEQNRIEHERGVRFAIHRGTPPS
ncbi:MAG: hypothetical protein E6J41_00545 [Chloroflexi bacterium]|nr:MAG: hypothetical protein E6J41_00545 [Chloroflexota bacterium]